MHNKFAWLHNCCSFPSKSNVKFVQLFSRTFEFFFKSFCLKVLMQNERGLGGKGLPCGDTASDDESSNRWSGKVETK